MIWSETGHKIYKNRKYLGQVILGYVVHLGLLLSISLVFPSVVFGGLFAISSVITAGLISVAALIYGALSFTAFLQRIWPDDSEVRIAKRELLFHGLYGLATTLWLFLPVSLYLIHASGGFTFLLTPFMLGFVAYVIICLISFGEVRA